MINDKGKFQMEFSYVEAVAPATSANLGSGFDVFSVALEGLFDKVSVYIMDEEGIELSVEGVGSGSIPVDPTRNTAGIVAEEILKFSKKKCGLKIKIEKGIKPGSGLGSSAASAAATALALNEALNLGLSRPHIIEFAAKGEIASAGAAHADNVSAAIMGFFTVVMSSDPVEVISLYLPQNVEFAIVIPEISFNTGMARSVLPKMVGLSDLVYNVGHAAAFISGIILNNVELMGKGMTDSVIENARSLLIPGLGEVKKAAVLSGAKGVAISGAGPSVLALVEKDKNKTYEVAEAMKATFQKHGTESKIFCSRPGSGAKITKRDV